MSFSSHPRRKTVSFFLFKHCKELCMAKLTLLLVQVNKCKMLLNSRRFTFFFKFKTEFKISRTIFVMTNFKVPC